MSATNTKRDPGHRAVQAAFFVGLCLIGLATVHNVVFEGMTTADRLTMPAFLADTYAKTGKLGVTLFLVSLGLLVIACGFLVRHSYGSGKKRGGWMAPDRLAPNPAWGESASAVGRVELATSKYMQWSQQAGMMRYEAAEQ